MTLHGFLRKTTLATALCLATGLAAGAAHARPPHDTVAPAVADQPLAGDERLLSDERLRSLYEARAFRSLWLDGEAAGLNERGAAVFRRLAQSDSEGLEPARYGVEEMEAAAAAGRWQEVERLLSSGLLAYVAELTGGRAATRSRRESGAEPADPVAAVRALAQSTDPARVLDALAPQHPQYQRLRAALATLRAVAAAGGWPAIPEGGTLDPGMRDPRVAALRQRLVATEGLPGEAAEPELYDPQLEAAVRRFQERNGLAVDGRVGRRTLAMLNRSAEDLIHAVEVNLERWRWLPRDLGERYLLVNIPAYELRAVEGGEVVLRMPVIAGMPSRETPILSDRVEYLEANPTWTVPPTIFARDYLPRLREDPGYLAQKNITLYASWSGSATPVDPYSVDWHAVRASSRSLPWRLVQSPGAHNALGRVKFMMPNRHAIYLHDTPDKHLFARARRAISSGCVRVADPDALAELLLRDAAGWDLGRLHGVYAGGRTTRIDLQRRWPVHLAYFTTWVDGQGVLHVYEDVYGKDAELIELLGKATLASAAPAPSRDQG